MGEQVWYGTAQTRDGTPVIRTFQTGATRDDDSTKLGIEGFISPIVLLAYARYMNKHRHQKDGTLRDPDNWQKGIPVESYRESLQRHNLDAWLISRGYEPAHHDYTPDFELEEALCGIIFNASGWLKSLVEKPESYANFET